MVNFILGVSLTINIIGIIGIFLYFKIKTLGIKKVQKEFESQFFVKDDELNDMLDKL